MSVRNALFLPSLAVLVSLCWLWPLGGDIRIADALFALEGGHWALRDHPLTAQWIHRGGKALAVAAWLSLFVAWGLAWRDLCWHAWRRPLATLLLSVLGSTGLVALLKRGLAVDCPWDLARYGGSHPFVPPFSAITPAAAGHCFPAAHASVGYAWVALYFLFSAIAPRHRLAGLGIGLSAGACFGAAQQLRGAHFLSHDVVALALCWLVAWLLHVVMHPAARTDGAGGAADQA